MSNHTTIAIIGAGFAGLSAALTLRKRLGKKVDIRIFDKCEMFTYKPGLHIAVGDPQRLRKLQFPLAKYYPHEFVHAQVTKITKDHTLTTASGEIWTFDYAIITTGADTNYYGNSTWKDTAYPIRNPEDVAPLNEALAIAETINVIGGGFTGVEVASVIAARFHNKKVRIIHPQARLLHSMSERTSRLATSRLERHGVEVILQDKVVEIGKDHLILQSGKKLDCDMSILSAGISPNNHLHQDEITFTDSYISNESNNIYLCGDASPHGLYTTAHNAIFEGRRTGDLIADQIEGVHHNYPPLENRSFLALALGPYDGLFTTPTYCIPIPWLIGFSKRIIEQRVLLEFKYKIMLPI